MRKRDEEEMDACWERMREVRQRYDWREFAVMGSVATATTRLLDVSPRLTMTDAIAEVRSYRKAMLEGP